MTSFASGHEGRAWLRKFQDAKDNSCNFIWANFSIWAYLIQYASVNAMVYVAFMQRPLNASNFSTKTWIDAMLSNLEPLLFPGVLWKRYPSGVYA